MNVTGGGPRVSSVELRVLCEGQSESRFVTKASRPYLESFEDLCQTAIIGD